jgi:hypothetical protein
MSDYSINSISSVRPAAADAATAPKFGLPGAGEEAPAKPGVPASAAAAENSPAARLAAQAAAAAQEKAAPKPALPVKLGGDVAVRFRVDRQTNDVTVFIVDRVSKRVLRSIPPEEVGKLHAGDLFELTG